MLPANKRPSDPVRRQLLRAGLPLIALKALDAFSQPLSADPGRCERWPEWEEFKQQFLSADGRVVDPSREDLATYSEGQSYALFFALVANDKPAFQNILHWTESNLCQGDITAHLPAWLWGRNSDGKWGVLDANAASDADLWTAYALGEAGRLWGVRRYGALSILLANRVIRSEIAQIPGLGKTLLPGPVGFKRSDGWKLNPSYMPMPLMRWLQHYSKHPDWAEIAETSLSIMTESAWKGVSPDWVIYKSGVGFVRDPVSEASLGAYNAIRVYLWAGMTAADSEDSRKLLAALAPTADLIATAGFMPEKINPQTLQYERAGPPGFAYAVIPFLSALGRTQALEEQKARLIASPVEKNAYYQQALALFSLGWMQERYKFDHTGRLHTSWGKPCATD